MARKPAARRHTLIVDCLDCTAQQMFPKQLIDFYNCNSKNIPPMESNTSHKLHCSSRRIIATLMTVIYFMIVLSPLTAAAMNAEPVTSECAGDCRICGCSPRAQADNTCCCAKKRQAQSHAHDDVDRDEPECCKQKQTETTVLRCGCPCGDKKQSLLSASASFELLPFVYYDNIEFPHDDPLFSTLSTFQATRFGDPPDQPPKLISFC